MKTKVIYLETLIELREYYQKLKCPKLVESIDRLIKKHFEENQALGN